MDVRFNLDMYALVEISKGNKTFLKYLSMDFVILDLILVEFYGVLLRDQDEEVAGYWYKKLESFILTANKETLKNAVKFRFYNKQKNLSFFDSLGYIFSKENNMKFVTGDKEFQDLEGVEFIK